MTKPICVCGCAQPVKVTKTTTKAPLRGWREIDGIRWCWFASKPCALLAAREAKRRPDLLRKVADVREDLATLKRYGVPPAIATAILVRVISRSEQRGYNRAYAKYQAKPRRRAA